MYSAEKLWNSIVLTEAFGNGVVGFSIELMSKGIEQKGGDIFVCLVRK